MLRAGVSAKNPPSIGKDQPGTKGTADASHETVLPLAPARMIEGVVRYADTKQPVPHARLTAYAGPQQFGPFLGLSEKADAEGRFRIHPFSGVYLRLTAYPPADAPYLIREKTFEWKTGTATAHIDVVLPRGILVRGRVVETATGNPIPHASIEFLPDNKTRAKAGDEVITGWQAIEQSDANGGYAIAVPPGSGHLLVYGPTGEYVSHAMGRREVDGLGLGGRRMYAACECSRQGRFGCGTDRREDIDREGCDDFRPPGNSRRRRPGRGTPGQSPDQHFAPLAGMAPVIPRSSAAAASRCRAARRVPNVPFTSSIPKGTSEPLSARTPLAPRALDRPSRTVRHREGPFRGRGRQAHRGLPGDAQDGRDTRARSDRPGRAKGWHARGRHRFCRQYRPQELLELSQDGRCGPRGVPDPDSRRDYRIVAKDFRVQAGQTLDLGDIVVDRPRGL